MLSNKEAGMKRISNNDELAVGNWYWVRPKGAGGFIQKGVVAQGGFVASRVECTKPFKLAPNGWKSIMNGMWCDHLNDQALAIYEIYGPIPFPDASDAAVNAL
jgi:hypothetical protein